jgi:signal transduction histidine kinase
MGQEPTVVEDAQAEIERLRARVRELEARGSSPIDQAYGFSLHDLLVHLPDIIAVLNRDMRLVFLNRAGPRRPLDELLQRDVFEFIAEPDQSSLRSAVESVFSNGRVQRVEVASSGGYLWEASLVPLKRGDEVVAVMGIAADVTQPRKLEEQRRQAQKLEALGRFTASIAHNFNNMLTVILTNLRTLPPSQDVRLREAEHAAQRAADMIRELMVFARGRQSGSQMGPTDLVELAKRTVSMCSTSFGGIRAELEVAGELPRVTADAGRVEQALINILLNARDALSGQVDPPPQVWVALDRVALPPSSGIASRSAIRVRVRDNGPGIASELLGRVFEPFFTTKDMHQGTGLGLATAYGTMVDHGGTLTCESQPGAGATFTLSFPIARDVTSA